MYTLKILPHCILRWHQNGHLIYTTKKLILGEIRCTVMMKSSGKVTLNINAAVNGHLELALLKVRQRFDAKS